VINGVTTIQNSLKTANIGDIASDDLQIIILCKLSCCLLRGTDKRLDVTLLGNQLANQIITQQAGNSRYKYIFYSFLSNNK